MWERKKLWYSEPVHQDDILDTLEHGPIMDVGAHEARKTADIKRNIAIRLERKLG